MGISDDWGTAVTVQAMVFRNLSHEAGSGVIFTHSPRRFGDMIALWGDYTPGNQGEDVVSGLVRTCPFLIRLTGLRNPLNRDMHASPFRKQSFTDGMTMSWAAMSTCWATGLFPLPSPDVAA